MGIVGPLLLTLVAATGQGITITDVPPDHWARPYVERVFRDSELTYCGELKFEGERTINRYQMAVMVGHLLDEARSSRTASTDQDELRQRLTDLTASMENLRERLSTLRTRVETLDEQVRAARSAVREPAKPRR